MQPADRDLATALALGHMLDQPPQDLLGVAHAAFPKTQRFPDLFPVGLVGTASEIVERDLGPLHSNLACDVIDCGVRDLGPSARKPARSASMAQ